MNPEVKVVREKAVAEGRCMEIGRITLNAVVVKMRNRRGLHELCEVPHFRGLKTEPLNGWRFAHAHPVI